jgi:hypothetical protein
LHQAADGGVFVMDWHDTGECHNYDKVHPSGRLYKVDYGTPKPVHPDLHKASDDDLVKAQLHKNDWWVRQARHVLQERASAGKLKAEVAEKLGAMLNEQKDAPRKLRALWALYCIGATNEKQLLSLLDSDHETVRSWAVRLLVDHGKASKEIVGRLTKQASQEKAAPVRLSLTSALQKLDLTQRWALAEALAAHAEDAEDANLPLLLWYGIEPLVPANPARAAELLSKCRIPLVRKYIARRIANLAD